MSTTAPQYTNSSVYTLPTPQILGAYPETPSSVTGADTPKANYNQREGPLEEAGRNISATSTPPEVQDKGTMTSELQPANDAKSGFPVHLMPDDLRHAADSKASSVYSQPDDPTATHARTEGEVPTTSDNTNLTEERNATRPDFPEVSQASHVAVKDVEIGDHAEAHDSTMGQATSASAMHTDSAVNDGNSTSALHNDSALNEGTTSSPEHTNATPMLSGNEHDSDATAAKLQTLNLNNESAGTRDSGIAEDRPLSAASGKTGMSDSNSFLSTGILPNATTELPAVAPVNPAFPRAVDEESLADSIPMPTQHLPAIRTSVPGGWNEADNRSSTQSTAAPDYASREASHRQASFIAPSAALLEATSNGPSGSNYAAQEDVPVAHSIAPSSDVAQTTQQPVAESSQAGLGVSQEPIVEREMSPDEYYQHARLGLRNASFTSTQKHELDLVPQATVPASDAKSSRDTVSVAAMQQDMSRSGSQQTQRTRFTDDKKDGYPEEKREVYPEDKRDVYPEDKKSLGGGARSTRSSASLREKGGHGKGALLGAGVAGAGAGYGASRLAGEDRGYAAARDYVPQQQQQQYHSAPQNNFMSSQGQRQNSYGQGTSAPFQNTAPQGQQYQQNQPQLMNVTPLNAGLGAPNGTANVPATRDAPAPVAAYGNLPAAAHGQQAYHDNEARRSNIFDSMSGVPDPTANYNQQPESRAASIRNAGSQSRAGSVRHSNRNSVTVLPVEPAHQVQVVPPAEYVEEEEVVEERPRRRSSVARSGTVRSRRSTIPENPAWASHKETKSTKWLPANPLWQRTPPKPAKKHMLPMSPWSPDPPGMRRRVQREKEDKQLKRRSSLPMHPFAADQPKRRSTVSSRRSMDERPVSRGHTIVRPMSRASTLRAAPSPALVSGEQEHTPNKLHKAQSVRSNRTASKVYESTPSGHVGEVVPAGGLGDGFPTQPGRVIAQEKVGQDVMYEGAPGVQSDNMTRNHSISTAGVGEGSNGHGILRNSQSQENARHTVRPGNIQPTYSYSGAPSAPGVQRYPMQRGETGYDPAAPVSNQPQSNGDHANHLMHQVSLGQQAHSQQYGGVQNAQQMVPQQGQNLSSYPPPQAARSG